MTTTSDEVMPALNDIKESLRARLAELSRVRDDEREARQRTRDKIQSTAHEAGSNNSIGSELDDMLESIGLEGRPISVAVRYRVTFRQQVHPTSVRGLTPTPWASYQNLVDAWVVTTAVQVFSRQVPRNHDASQGCACTIGEELTDEAVAATMGSFGAALVERVSTELMGCDYAEYPYSSAENMACSTVRAMRERLLAQDRGTVVRRCEENAHTANRHRHVLPISGHGLGYTGSLDGEVDRVVPGEYGKGDIVGLPVTVLLEDVEVEDDDEDDDLIEEDDDEDDDPF